YGTDIMLESLGAALTLATLYFYVTARQEDSVWRSRSCALLFLGLYLTKYNYWMLLAAGLLLSALWEYRALLGPALLAASRFRPLSFLAAQLHHPLTYLLLPAFGLAVWVRGVRPVSVVLAGKPLQIRTFDIPAQLCYTLLLLRVMPWWWRSGRHAIARLP